MRSFGNKKHWCHLSFDKNELYTNKEIRKSEPKNIGTFRELVQTVARISNHHPDYNLFFRGQPKDYKLASNLSSFYPTIFRNPKGKNKLTMNELERRFEKLEKCSNELIQELENLKIDNISKIKKFPELQWSILQHYEVCDTPLLDVTHSLRVAASFALNDTNNYSHQLDSKDDNAYIFIFALPYPNGTISYSTEEELLNVRLLNASPSEALRPHFQEGFLIGSFPSYVKKKHMSLDFARRLIAKIKISKQDFWGNDFHAIPNSALYPKNDQIETLCSKIENKYKDT